MSIVLKNLSKSFGAERAVDAVDINIATGEFFCVLGASGCGKSTLLRLISGLETLDKGSIILDGKEVSSSVLHVPPEERAVGFVFQSYALWPHMSVLENVAFPAEAQGIPKAAARKAAIAHLETVELTDFIQRKPAALSGGQRQRVALARCLAGGARTILMDEPLANLDPHLRATMEDELMHFHKRAGVTTVYITHDQREAMALGDRLAVMQKGRFLQVGSPQAIYGRPNSKSVAGFIGRGSVVKLPITGNHVRLGDQAVEVDLGAPVVGAKANVLFRPQNIRVGGEGGLRAHISNAVYRGGVWEGRAVLLDVPEVAFEISHEQPLQMGAQINIEILGGWVLPSD